MTRSSLPRDHSSKLPEPSPKTRPTHFFPSYHEPWSGSSLIQPSSSSVRGPSPRAAAPKVRVALGPFGVIHEGSCDPRGLKACASRCSPFFSWRFAGVPFCIMCLFGSRSSRRIVVPLRKGYSDFISLYFSHSNACLGLINL